MTCTMGSVTLLASAEQILLSSLVLHPHQLLLLLLLLLPYL
jgi:hypothetical protein